jgi:phosphoenolpyruvate carboxykinase (GTP)
MSIDAADLDALLSLDTNGWRTAVPQIREHYAQFGDKLPSKLAASLTELESSLA